MNYVWVTTLEYQGFFEWSWEISRERKQGSRKSKREEELGGFWVFSHNYHREIGYTWGKKRAARQAARAIQKWERIHSVDIEVKVSPS